MKKIFAILLLTAFLPLSPAFAADDLNVDIAQISCKDLLEEDEDGAAAMMLWADGYLSAKSGDTRISTEWIAKLAANIGAYCAINPNKTFMDAINSIKR